MATGSLFKGDIVAALCCLGPAEVSQVPSKVRHPWPRVIPNVLRFWDVNEDVTWSWCEEACFSSTHKQTAADEIAFGRRYVKSASKSTNKWLGALSTFPTRRPFAFSTICPP